jgi:hypothetical protein
VVAAEHERPEPGSPPGGDLLAGRVELAARRVAFRQLAVADVREVEVFEVSLEGGRVRLDRVGGKAEVARPGVGALAEVDAPFEGDAVDDDAGLGEGRLAGNEAG